MVTPHGDRGLEINYLYMYLSKLSFQRILSNTIILMADAHDATNTVSKNTHGDCSGCCMIITVVCFPYPRHDSR